MSKLSDYISTTNVLAKQKKNLIIVMISAVVILTLLVNAFPSGKKKPGISLPSQQKTKMVTALDTIDASDLWMFKSEERLTAQEKHVNELRSDIDRVLAKKPDNSKNKEFDDMKNRIVELEKMLTDLSTGTSNIMLAQAETTQANFPGYNYPIEEDDDDDVEIITLSINLATHHDEDEEESVLTNKNFIPVGSFAKAVLLTGVDAPASVSSSDNPVPMLLKVIDDAIMPRGFRGQVDTCHVTASAYGDISEERARVRLDKISCTMLDGRVFVSNVDGYVAGEDGKPGIRGKAIWREGALVARSFAAGFLGGVSSGIGDAAGSTSTSALGSVKTYENGEIFQNGVGDGAGAALNKLSEYYIKRAEQYHPIIEVEAGRMVDIIINTKKDSKSDGLFVEWAEGL